MFCRGRRNPGAPTVIDGNGVQTSAGLRTAAGYSSSRRAGLERPLVCFTATAVSGVPAGVTQTALPHICAVPDSPKSPLAGAGTGEARASWTSGMTVIWLRSYCQLLRFTSIYLTGIADCKCLGTTHVLQSLDGFQNNFKQFQTIRSDVQHNYDQLHQQQHLHLQLTLNFCNETWDLQHSSRIFKNAFNS